MSNGSSFLKIGINLATFNFSGKMPVVEDWLIMIVKDWISGSLICCSNLVDSPSEQALCLVYWLKRSLLYCWWNVSNNACKICLGLIQSKMLVQDLYYKSIY